MRRHEQILRRAEAMGLIAPAPPGEPAEPPARRLERLLREGQLSERTVHDLERELATPAGALEDATAAPASPDPERYELLEELGAGGMGRVLRARDLRLGRFVALKLLHRRDPDSERRFLREAQTQARVDHPAVCKIFEVGADAERPYIAMQLVEGRTLAEAREMTLRERVAIGIEIAGGVHAAHRLGLIHRDLKPGNILVERDDDGRWRAFITDFGLALELDAANPQTQAIVGTPHYMAPEQARGLRTIDHRADVYGLGATLFSMLTGRLPFEGPAGDVLAAVMAGTPPSLRRVDPSLPRDLETIVARCMEREPAHRYPSARAVAEDLARFQRGEPILARPPSLLYRGRRFAARHRAIVAVTALAVTGLLGAGAVALRERQDAGQRAALAQRFGQDVERVETVLRAGYTLPLHDVRREKAQVRARMERMRAEMARLGPAAAAPGHYALGRGALALGDLALARRHLEEAWRRGLRTPEVAYALGHALARLYEEGLERAERLRPEAARERRRRELAGTLRAPALAYLARGAAGGPSTSRGRSRSSTAGWRRR
jgi:eukaryotic-like serine/threonine-protein kinase